MAALVLDNPAWRFVVALYAEEGVAPECLRLQDEHGLDVSLALFCLWLGEERGIALDDASLVALRRVASDWAGLAVGPLRSVRRAVKASPLLAHEAVGAFRGEVAKLELAAERIEIAFLHDAAAERWPEDRHPADENAATGNLARLLALGGAAAAPALAAALARRRLTREDS